MKYNYCLIDKMATPTPTPPNPTVATLKQVTKPTVPKFKGMCWGTQVDCYPDGEPEDVVTYATLLTPPEEGKEWSVFDGIDLLKYAAQAEPSYDTAADAVNCTVARELKITLTPPVLHRPGCYIAVPAARTVQVLNGVKSQYYGISVYVTVASRGVTAKVSTELVSSAKAIEKVIAEEQTATKSVVPTFVSDSGSEEVQSTRRKPAPQKATTRQKPPTPRKPPTPHKDPEYQKKKNTTFPKVFEYGSYIGCLS